VIDVDEEAFRRVVQKMSGRRAEMIEMRPSAGNRLRLVFYAPTRGLIGYQGELLTDTRGTAIMNRCSMVCALQGEIQGRRNGVLISNDRARPWPMRCSSWKTRPDDDSSRLERVYKGMIVGSTPATRSPNQRAQGKQLTTSAAPQRDGVRLTRVLDVGVRMFGELLALEHVESRDPLSRVCSPTIMPL